MSAFVADDDGVVRERDGHVPDAVRAAVDDQELPSAVRDDAPAEEAAVVGLVVQDVRVPSRHVARVSVAGVVKAAVRMDPERSPAGCG